MKGKNVLVTGGTGFIASHLVELLVKEGANIFVTYRSLDHRQYFFTQGLDKKAVMANCELKNKERVMNLVSDYEIDYIFHLAAQPLVTVAYTYPYETLMSNIIGTINILEAARSCPHVKGTLVFTSDKAYGKHEKLPYDEFSPLKGDHPYDCSKSCADLIAQTYYKTYALPIIIVRAGNIFGPGDLNFNRIIPGALQCLLKNEPLQIRSDGKFIRAYLYVKDAVNACLKLMQNLEKVKGEAFNIGSENIFSVLEVVSNIERVLNTKIETRILNITKNEIPKQYLDYQKIKNTIGWKNEIDFPSAIKETFEWYKNHQRC